jgi:hypothetical protein
MAIRALNNSEHNRLLQPLQHLPLEEDQADNFKTQLNQFFDEYQSMMMNLSATIQNYREVAALINARQPLVKRHEP